MPTDVILACAAVARVPVTVEADRARTTHHIANDHLVPDFGPYFEVQNINDINGVFNVVNKEYVIFVTDAGHNSGNTTTNTIGERKRITHVTQMGDIYRIYVENDIGLDAKKIFKDISTYVHSNSKCQTLWASCRMPYDYISAEESYADIITMPPEMIMKLKKFGKTSEECSKETVKTFFSDAKSSGYKI